MSKPYQNTEELFKALIDSKKVTDGRGYYHFVNGNLTWVTNGESFCANNAVFEFACTPKKYREHIEPVTLEMAIAHYKKTGFRFGRKKAMTTAEGEYFHTYCEDGTALVVGADDIHATNYVLLTE